MTQKEKILDKVRDICNLKRLEFGCEVKYKEQEEIYRFVMTNPLVCIQCKCETGVHLEGLTDKSPQSFCKHRFEEWFEIIGLPVELNHLILTLSKSTANLKLKCGKETDTSDLAILTSGKIVIANGCLEFGCGIDCDIAYDLTKSVSENLDNLELLTLIGELLNIDEEKNKLDEI